LPLSGQKRVGIMMSAKQLNVPMLAKIAETNVATIAIAPAITLGTAGSNAVKTMVVAGKAEKDV